MRYIVVTDLDGTLLDHKTYEYTPASDAIKELEKHDIPIILNPKTVYSIFGHS